MPPKFLYFVAALIIFILIFWFVFLRNGQEYNRPLREGDIIFFGDSLVEGVGATSGNDLPSQLSRIIGQPVLNVGRSGDTTASALERLGNDVLSKNPRMVIILLGGNDFLTQVPADETFRNLGTMIDRIQQKKTAVVLLGVRGGLPDDSYAPRFKELAKTKKVAYVPNVLSGIIGHVNLMSDAVHPNDEGYAKMAEKIAPAVRSVLR